MKHLTRLCLVVFIGNSLSVLAQTGANPSASNPLMPSLDNISPPSPNVSALNKFGDIPVGPSTGIPQVTVPIYSWSNKNFGKDINISLDYHAGGIKVDEMASDVGLGWALNAGGVVSRTVRGIYDEYPVEGFLYKTMPSDIQEGNTQGVINSARVFYRMNAGLVDTQNDLFNYNFNGRNGRFVLGKNNDMLLLEQAKLKISYNITNINNNPLISKITIIDEQGYTYVFSDYEYTTSQNPPYTNKYTSAWYLTEIIHPAGKDKITFQYENYSLSRTVSRSYSTAFPIYINPNLLSAEFTGAIGEFVNCKRVKNITFPDGNVITFGYKSTGRQDLGYDPTSDSPKLLDKITISKGSTKTGFKLVQDYSVGNRATLKSVTEFGGASELASKPYTFTYITSPALPARLSIQQDHWGYPTLDGGMIPHEYFLAPGGQYPPYREFQGGNRDTNPTWVKAGSLQKITYPTGGATAFEMEANTAKDNWLEQNLPVTVPLPPYTDRSKNEPLNSNNYPAAQTSFVYQGENNTATNFKLTVTPDGSGSSSAIKFELYNASNQLVNTQQINFSVNNLNTIERSFGISNLVKNATYYFRIYTINLSDYYNSVQIDWREVNPGGTSNIVLRHVQPYVGGLRAKRILDYSENGGSPVKIREYEYTMEDGTTSSGSLGIRPVYTYLVYYDYTVNAVTFPLEPPSYHGNFDYNYIIRTSGGVNPAIFVNGSPVTYKRVVEKIGQNGNYLGRTVRYFTNFADSAPFVPETFPFVPPHYAPWDYGHLKKEEIYNNSDQIIRTTENTYQSVADLWHSNPTRVENFRSIVIAPVKFEWPHPVPITGYDPKGDPHYFLMSSITPFAGRSQLVQTKITESEPGQTAVVTTTDYSYDAANYYLKESTVTDSRNRQVKTVLNYPKDMVAANIEPATYQGMIDKNIISPVIEEKVLVGSTQQTSVFTRYTKWHNSFFAPERLRTRKMAMTEEDRIVYLEYDTHGAPLSVQQLLGPKVSYIWGYGGTRLIGQVSNMDYSQVRTLLGGAAAIETFRNKTAPTDAEIDTFLAPLVNGLSAEGSITRFKHDTLRGLTSQLDEAGRKTSYEYDEFNRLKAVRDQQGNLVEEYKYNYRNQ